MGWRPDTALWSCVEINMVVMAVGADIGDDDYQSPARKLGFRIGNMCHVMSCTGHEKMAWFVSGGIYDLCHVGVDTKIM